MRVCFLLSTGRTGEGGLSQARRVTRAPHLMAARLDDLSRPHERHLANLLTDPRVVSLGDGDPLHKVQEGNRDDAEAANPREDRPAVRVANDVDEVLYARTDRGVKREGGRRAAGGGGGAGLSTPDQVTLGSAAASALPSIASSSSPLYSRKGRIVARKSTGTIAPFHQRPLGMPAFALTGSIESDGPVATSLFSSQPSLRAFSSAKYIGPQSRPEMAMMTTKKSMNHE